LTDLFDSFIKNKSYLISGFCMHTSTGSEAHLKFQFLRPKAYRPFFMCLYLLSTHFLTHTERRKKMAEESGRFPDPHEFEVPSELEGWEEMYPSHHLFLPTGPIGKKSNSGIRTKSMPRNRCPHWI
jgi:hypothetical protein